MNLENVHISLDSMSDKIKQLQHCHSNKITNQTSYYCVWL